MSRLIFFILLWLGIAGGFLVWRLAEPIVWCDSVLVASNLFEEPETLKWSNPDSLKRIVHSSFYDVGSEGYRPLSRMILWTGVALFSDPSVSAVLTVFWFAGAGAVIGAMALSFFLVSRRFLRSDITALFAVFLFLFSAPVVTGAWNISCGFQAIVPLMICLGLLLYWRAAGLSWGKGGPMAGLCAVLFFGPWFREFIGLLPLLIIFLEAQRARRPTIFMAVAGLFFLHAIFPTALIKLLFFSDLPLHSIFAMGHFGRQVAVVADNMPTPWISQILAEIRWAVPLHFLTLYPPTLFLVTLFAFFLPLLRVGPGPTWVRSRYAATEQRPSATAPYDHKCILACLFVFGTAIGLLGLRNEFGFALWPYLFGLWLCFGLAFLGWYRDAFLAWWFALFFLPFLKVYTEPVHLAYALLPASIIVTAALEDLWQSFQSLPRSLFRLARHTLCLAMTVAVVDHSLNPFSSFRVVHAMNDGIMKMADWFASNVPEGSIVISNALHAEDIRLFASGHIKVFWTVKAGIPRDEEGLSKPADLERLLQQNAGKRDVYFLDIDFDYAPEKVNYHSHKYVRNQSVKLETVGLIHRTQIRYPFIDPLKGFIPRPYISFLGPPDLENDFYVGPAQDSAKFLREVYAEYHVYKVTGTKVDPWDPVGPVKMVREGYRGFNILLLNRRFFAIRQTDGAFEMQKIQKNEYSMSFMAESYDEILRQIDDALGNTPLPGEPRAAEHMPSADRPVPLLIEQGYRGFNFIRYGETIYAILQGEGEFDIERIKNNQYSRWFAGRTVLEVKNQVDQSLKKGEPKKVRH